MKKIKVLFLFSGLFFVFLLSACAPQGTDNNAFAEKNIYNSSWEYAKYLQLHGRYEMAREYYLIALSEAQSYDEQKWIEEELRNLDLQIKSRR